ncbi:MAG: hypothetical protein ACREVV_18070 [Steroidobacteraceae bacterium]
MTRTDRPVVRTGSAAVLVQLPKGTCGAFGPLAKGVAFASLVTVLLAMSAGCSHVPRPHWPWHRTPVQPAQPVHELIITAPDGSAADFPQYWNRNTLVIDLQSASGSGSVMLKPREHTLWPVRMAFRVMPGQFGALEVRAKQRVVLPITAAGTRPVDLELAPGVFIMKTPQMTVLWGPGATAQPSGD